MPVGAELERTSPRWTAETVPPALLGIHHTSVWARLVVLSGQVRFVEDETSWHSVATVGQSVVIVPDRRHHIEPDPAAEFQVEFFSLAGNPPAEAPS